MVGRPRSKGCSTCRARHLKCDERRPVCSRCAKDKFECGPRSDDFQVIQYSPPKLLARAQPHLSNVTDDNIFITYLNHKLFSDHDTRVRWLGFNAIARPNTLSRKCLLALSKSFYGRVQHELSVTRHGIVLYGQCLGHINKGLSHVKGNSITDMLLSVMIMGFYEMMLCTSPDAWIRHGQGISTLFQMQGPEMCRDKNMFELFRSNRFLIILSSLASRQPTFLSQEPWKAMPWQQQNIAKDSMDLLLDMMADIPALRSTLLVLQNSLDTDEAKAFMSHKLTEEALPVFARLLEWRKSWEALPEGHIISISAEDERQENSSLHFTSLRAANCCSLYDASLILVLETILLSAQPGQLHAGAAATFHEKARQAAMEICASLDFQLQNSHTRLGQLFVLWPLREAGKILGNGTPGEQSLLERHKQKIATGQDLWEIAKSAFGKYG